MVGSRFPSPGATDLLPEPFAFLPEQLTFSRSNFASSRNSLLPPGTVCLLPEHVCILPEQFASPRSNFLPPGTSIFLPEQVSSSRSSLGRGGHLQYTVTLRLPSLARLIGRRFNATPYRRFTVTTDRYNKWLFDWHNFTEY